MTLRSRLSIVLAFLLLYACASHREPPLPTLEDYSDRVSVFTEKYLEDWKAGARDAAFYGERFAWSGPLPGEGLTEAPSRPPLRIGIYRNESVGKGRPSPRPSPGGRGGGGASALRMRLAEIRGRFASLGRTEQIIFARADEDSD